MTDNPRQRERDGSAGEKCPSLLQLYSLTNCLCLYVCNTPSQTETDKFKEICGEFSKMPAYWWWTTGALELQEHTANPWGAAPAHTHVAVPTAAPRLPLLRFLSHSSELWTRSSAIVIQLPQSAMIHSPVKRLQLLAPACLVVSSPQSRVSSTCGSETSAWLSSPSAPCTGSCSPASRGSHWKEMFKPVSCSASQFIPQTRHFFLLLLPLS